MDKKIDNIYKDICDIKNIINVYRDIKCHVKNKRKIELFDNYYTSNICSIKNTLANKSYIPGKYNIFAITKPKLRIVMSQNISDKVVNHLVTRKFLIPYLEKSLIDNNVATRIGKGTKYGLDLCKKYFNILKNKNYYYLKFDISKYFYNIDHEILKNMLSNKICDKDALKILFDIIDSTDESYVNEEIYKLKNSLLTKQPTLEKDINKTPFYAKGKGVPIGNLSSQFLAIYYLNGLDHFIKEKLKIKYYIRYMDDGLIMHKDKEYLKYCLSEIEKYLKRVKLTLNSKTIIGKIDNGINFLGFNFKTKNRKTVIRVNKKCKQNFYKKVKKSDNKIELASYKGHLSYCTSSIYYEGLKKMC